MFKEDLVEGRNIEMEFAKRLIKPWVVSVEMAKNKCFRDWDIKVEYENKEPKTFEIKSDRMSGETGNIVFEYECNGKPSGIFSSKADYVVYYFDGNFYRQDRGKLVAELMDVMKRKVIWGDNENSKMYLINKEVAKVLFNKM